MPNPDEAPQADQRICDCGARISDGAKFCSNCGQPVPEDAPSATAPVTPPHDGPTCVCGYNYSAGVSACPRCGEAAPTTAAPSRQGTSSNWVGSALSRPGPTQSESLYERWRSSSTGVQVLVVASGFALLILVIVLAMGATSNGSPKSQQEWIREASFAYIYNGSLAPQDLQAAGDALMSVSKSPDGGAASDALHEAGRHYRDAAAAARAGAMQEVADNLNAAADDMHRANQMIDAMGGFESIQ